MIEKEWREREDKEDEVEPRDEDKEDTQVDVHCPHTASPHHIPMNNKEPRDIGAAQVPVAVGACNEDVA